VQLAVLGDAYMHQFGAYLSNDPKDWIKMALQKKFKNFDSKINRRFL